MKKNISNYLISISLIIGIVFIAINFWSFNHAFYDYEFTKSQVAEELVLSEQTVKDACFQLLDYVKGQDADLDYQIKNDLQNEAFYTAKDILHMQDVRDLYLNFKTFNTYTLLGLIVLITYQVIKHASFKQFYMCYKRVLMCLVAIILACLFLMIVDFQSFWYYCHFLFFDNMLWVISPSESRLIVMMNQTLFNDLLFLIIFSIIIMLGILTLIFHFINQRKEKRI